MSRSLSRRRLQSALVWGVLAASMLFAVLPLLWGLSTALKPNAVAESIPPVWWPSPLTLSNFSNVLFASQFVRYVANSFIVATGTIVLSIAIAVHAGYAAARFTFAGKNQLLLLILSTAMVPGIAILVPIYLLATSLGLHNTYMAMILVYTAWQAPTATWIMRGFFQSIPRELEESAFVDGCSRVRAFYRIVLPLTQPGMAAVAILIFVYVWNDFLIAYALTITDDMRLVQPGLYFYVTAFGVEWSKLMAAAILGLVPPLVTFVLLQGRFIQGLTKGAIK